MEFTPHKYQEEAIGFLLERGCAGLFLSPGLGKTSITLAASMVLMKEELIDAVLVIAPLRPCYMVWPKEIQKWNDFNGMTYQILHGPDKAKALRTKAQVYIINPEGLQWLFRELATFKAWPFNMLIVDESSKFKHTNTQRFKTLRPHLPRFKRRVILTGSPASNGLMDLFGQIFVMDRGATFGPYITKFRAKYFDQVGYGGYEYRLKKGADKEISDALKGHVLQMSAIDYLDLPELTINDIKIDLPKAAMKVYLQMENLLQLQLKEGSVTAGNSGIASMKCRQIASGGVYTDTHTAQQIHYAKAEAVAEIVEELEGQPVLVAYEFDHDRDRLLEVLGKNTPYIAGGVSTKKSIEIEAAWNRGDIPVLLGQPQSMAHGLNLQGSGNTIIWHTLTWNYEDYEQLIDRVWRQGQKNNVIVHRIIANNTIDEAVSKSLASKAKGQNALFDSLKDYMRNK